MPCFNAATHLKGAVDSILLQTYAALEFIIIDDGSTDDTVNILSSITDPRVIVLRNERNLGIVESLNRGFAHARGEFIARMDADDVALADRLACQVARFQADPDLAVLGTGVNYIDSAGRARRSPRVPPQTNLGIQWRLLWSNCLHHPTVMFRRRDLTLPLYSPEFRDIEDWELWFRLAAQMKFAALPQRLLLHRRHPRSVSGQRHTAQKDSVACLLQSHVMQAFGVELSREESRTVYDPAFWLLSPKGLADEVPIRSPLQIMQHLYAAFLSAHPMITRQERQEINADLRFYAMRSALIALRAPRGSLGRRLTMVFEAAKMLIHRPKAIGVSREVGESPESSR
jgi:hypothetical protein